MIEKLFIPSLIMFFVFTAFIIAACCCYDDTDDEICQAGAMRCSGAAIVEECSSDGTEWVVSETCGGLEVCVSGACEMIVCNAGDRICDGNDIMECNSTGTGFITIEDCAASSLVCNSGVCVTP